MRTREEIEIQAGSRRVLLSGEEFYSVNNNKTSLGEAIIIELLLDIRDLEKERAGQTTMILKEKQRLEKSI